MKSGSRSPTRRPLLCRHAGPKVAPTCSLSSKYPSFDPYASSPRSIAAHCSIVIVVVPESERRSQPGILSALKRNALSPASSIRMSPALLEIGDRAAPETHGGVAIGTRPVVRGGLVREGRDGFGTAR